ncbi:MAG TPA: aldo/keto reductase, partial [Tepidisphaeraceae bacterium]|nr:aldo/keto reductase [Tepidisphaeraceae bacterium]
YIDTSPGYGDGHSESVIGEALQGRRDSAVLASRVGYRGCSAGAVRVSVEASLRRLRTEALDIVQLDGDAYKDEDLRAILRDDLLEMLEALRDQGKVRFLGFVVKEPWTARPLIASFRFDMLQVCYNLIDQAAGRHLLNEAKELDLGVVAMNPLTDGVFQRICRELSPRWQDTRELDEVALKFVLSDSRVHTAVLDLWGVDDVARYATIAAMFEPTLDMASLSPATPDPERTGEDAQGSRRVD